MKNLILFLFFLCMTTSFAIAQQNDHILHFKGGTYAVNIKDRLPEQSGTEDMIISVWVNENINDPYAYLSKLGYDVLSKLNNRSYTIKSDRIKANNLLTDNGIYAVFEIPGSYKISSNVINSHSGQYKISLYAPFTMSDVNRMLSTEIITVRETQSTEINIADIRCSGNIISDIAALPFVRYISAIPAEYKAINYRKEMMESVAEAHASAANGGLDLHGAGITLGNGDDGYFNHVDLNDRVINFSPEPTGGHGVHTSGTIAGAGLIDPQMAGKTPMATLVYAYFYDIISNAPAYYSGNDVHTTNNSYGVIENVTCAEYGDYNTYSEEVDNQAADMPDLLHVFAAGNSGGSGCSPYSNGYNTVFDGPQCAKNTIVVGALGRDMNFTLAGFSSKGPTDDGRLKPEISTMGNCVSTTNNNTYGSSSGTSMAAPSVTGAIGLIQEAYKAQQGSYPRQDLIKAVICNTADDIGTEGPDFGTGFGKLNTAKAAKQINNTNNILSSVSQGGQNDINISIPSGATKIAITICWIDPAADPSSSQQLVNDIDLQLVGSSTYLPWVLDPSPSGCSNPATRGADHLNNIEKISVLNPVSGTYTIRVLGANIMGTQNYALTYYIEESDMRISAPFKGEKFAPNDFLYYCFEIGSVPNNSNTTRQYSLDGGTNWTTFSSFPLTLPSATTASARIKITDNGNLITATTGDFTIAPVPTGLTASSLCPGYASLNWTAVSGASGYNIYKKSGSEMSFLFDTTSNSAIVSGLSVSDPELLGVSAIFPNNIESRRSIGVFVTANSGTCPWSTDLEAIAITTPVSGRKYTSSQLGTEQISLQLKNLGTIPASNFPVYYKVNGTTIATETFTGTINPGNTSTYVFTATYNFSSSGNYNIEAGIANNYDAPYINNNIIHSLVRHLQNDPITLSYDIPSTFSVDFETAQDTIYTGNYFGMNGIDRFDYNALTNSSRARTFVTNGIAKSGTKAASLDAISANSSSTNELIMTANLSNYSLSDNIRLDFSYLNHSALNDPGDNVWIRGSDLDSWIQVFNLFDNQESPGIYKSVVGINISKLLSDNGQNVSSSFQIKFGQQGTGSIVAKDWKGGYTFDDIRLLKVKSDLELTSVLFPNEHPCELGSNETITVRITNTTSIALNNGSIWYRLNNILYGPFNIGNINGNSYINYDITGVNLSAYTQYKLDVFINTPNDIYYQNDSINNYIFYNSPHITTFPYLEGFESSDGGWHSYGKNNSWAYGSPAKPVINRAANGTKIWATGISGKYNNNEKSYLESPCFDLSGFSGNPYLSFSFANQIETNFDEAWVEYSEDAINWIKLGSVSTGTNWYNSSGNYWDNTKLYWHVATCPIPLSTITNKTNVRFRFALLTDVGLTLEGLCIDDIHIYSPVNIYQGSNTNISLTPSTNGWTDFSSAGNLIVSLKPEGQNLGNTAVGVYFNPNVPTRHDVLQFYLDRNFTIVPTNPLTSGEVKVRLYFTDLESDSCRQAVGSYDKPIDAYELGVTQISSANDDGIYGNETNQTVKYFNYAATDLIPFMNGYYIEFPVTGFSEFYLNPGGPNNNLPLPLELLYFAAHLEDNNTGKISYQLANANDLKKLILQKSTDISFKNYQLLSEWNLSGIQLKNEFIDADKTNSGIYYYRLMGIDKAGKIFYSPVRSLHFNGLLTAQLDRNPFDAVTKMNIQGLTSGQPFHLTIINQYGQLVHTVKHIAGSTNESIIIPADLLPGAYLFQIVQGEKILNVRGIRVE